MCLIALFFRVVDDAPVVIGANREELYARGGEPPRILQGSPLVLAGTDPVAGGTWLGVNAHGMLVAITNRPKSEVPREPRSRGLLARQLLARPSVAAAVEFAAKEISTHRYAGCNILCVDGLGAEVIHAGDWLRIRPLPPGLHVLTAADVNDAGDRRLGHALWWLSQASYANSDQCVSALQNLCAQPGNGDPPICLRGERSGTVSSSIVVLGSEVAGSRYLHAQGPPDRAPYEDYSPSLRQILSGSATDT